MQIRSLAFLLACSAVACGGRLASETSPPAGTTSPPGGTLPTLPPGGSSPPGTPIGTSPTPPGAISYGGSGLGYCSGDEAVLINDCTPCGSLGYALCDGTSYTECSCALPAGWTLRDESLDAGLGDDGSRPVSLTDVEQLQANANGGVVTNTIGVTGGWYVYGDGWGTEGYDGGTGASGERGNCELLGGFPVADCSTITSPLPPAPFATGPDAGLPLGYANGFPPAAGSSQTFCLSGTGARVIVQDGGTAPDYSDIYGIGIGLDFNNVGGVKSPYNAPAEGVVGVQFTLASRGSFPNLRVEFPTTETDGTGSNDPYTFLPAAPGVYTVYWSTLETPYPPVVGENIAYTPSEGLTAQPKFNPSHLLSIQFHVPTNVTQSVPVNHLCVSNLSAIIGQPRP